MTLRNLTRMLAVTAIACPAAVARTQTVYLGEDKYNSSIPPDSNTALAYNAWSGAAGPASSVSLYDFESPDLTDSSSTPLTYLDLGGSAALTADADPQTGITPFFLTTSDFQSANGGFNTTPNGNVRALFGGTADDAPLTYTLTFTSPVKAFGAYLTGEGNSNPNGSFTLTYNDGIDRNAALTDLLNYGGTRFVGIVDTKAAITSVTLTLAGTGTNGANFSLDDVRWVVPAPGSLMVALLGILPGFALLKRRRTR